jgi:hypothetical protein
MPLEIFVAGFVGALAPEVLRLYNLKLNQVTLQPWYFVISGVYALLGGYLATIAPGVDAPWWAFVVGAGLPTVVNTAIKAAGLIAAPAGTTTSPPAAQPREVTRGAAASRGERRGTFWDFVRAL